MAERLTVSAQDSRVTTLTPTFRFGRNPRVEGNPIKKAVEAVSHRFDLVPPADLDAAERERRIKLRHEEKGYIYRKPGWRRTATLVETSHGNSKKQRYEFQTREALMHPGRAITFLANRLSTGRWLLVEFPEATQNPPRKIKVRN